MYVIRKNIGALKWVLAKVHIIYKICIAFTATVYDFLSYDRDAYIMVMAQHHG